MAFLLMAKRSLRFFLVVAALWLLAIISYNGLWDWEYHVAPHKWVNASNIEERNWIDKLFDDWKQDTEVQLKMLACCHSACEPEKTQTVTKNEECNARLREAVAPVKCEIAKNFNPDVKRDRDSCTPEVMAYSCDSLSQSSLPCERPYYLRQFNFHTQFHCLMRIADFLAANSSRVPRIHHQVWFYGPHVTLEFYQYISLLATLRFFRPQIIFIWNDGNLPHNKWWQEFISHLNQKSADNLILPLSGAALTQGKKWNILERTVHVSDTILVSVVRTPPNLIYGQKINYPQHMSDVMRLEASLLFGGFYTDVDTVVIRDIEPLMKFPVTMGMENPTALTNMAILGERYSPHYYLWHHNYKKYSANHWSENSILSNFRLARFCSDFVHIENSSFIKPNWDNKHVFYSGDLDLRDNYMVHLYWRYLRQDNMKDPLGILKSATLGPRLFRNIYYGLPVVGAFEETQTQRNQIVKP